MSSGSERLFLVHWNGAEAERLAEPLRQSGWPVEVESQDGKRAWEAVRANRPRALIISLERLPSHGRETALAVRSTAAGHTIPLVFVGGDPEKVAAIRTSIPDAAFVARDALLRALQDAFGDE